MLGESDPSTLIGGLGGPHWRLGRTRGESIFYSCW